MTGVQALGNDGEFKQENIDLNAGQKVRNFLDTSG